MKTCAHQYGYFVQCIPGALIGFDIVPGQARFFVAVPHAAHNNFLAFGQVGPKLFAKASLIGRDQARCGGQNMRRRAVIALQADNLRAREIALKAQNIVNFRTAPTIDRLVVIADTANIIMRLCQQAQPQILHRICVLIFINQYVFELVLILYQHGVIFTEQAQTFQ